MIIMRKVLILKPFIFVLLFAFGLQPLEAQDSNADKVVRIGVLTDNYPFSFIESDGEIQGFAYELVKELTQTMSINSERIQGTTEYINSAFKEGELDLLQSFSRSAQRNSQVAFSVPYLTMTGQIFVRNDGPKIKQFSDLKGLRVLVHKGSVGEELLRKAGLESSIRYVESVEKALEMLNKGEGDATLASHLTGLSLIHKLGLKNLKPLDVEVEGYKVEYCIAVQKENQLLLEQVNEGLATLVRTGRFDALYQKWFGFIEPIGYTPEQILFIIAIGLLLALAIAAWSSIRQRTLKNRIAKQAHSLRESEEKYFSIYKYSNIAILLTSVEGKVYAANDFACRMLGMTEEEICNVETDKIFDRSDVRFASLMKDRNLNGFVKGEINMVHKNGTVFPGMISSALFDDRDNNKMATVVIRDLTEEKQIMEELIMAKEKAEESDRLKTEFLRNISHEIRTPMNSIIGFSETLNQPDLTPEMRAQFTGIIVQNTHRLLDFMTDIINISTIEAGKMEVHKAQIDPVELLDELFSQFTPLAEKKNIKLNKPVVINDENKDLVSDKMMLTEILSKLLGNALKFTDFGSVSFGCNIGKDQAEFYIEDTGIGILPDMHKVIFKRFSQQSPDSKRFIDGAGLGLAIAKGFIEKLNGQINLSSEPGKGSIFYFSIPL